MAHIKDKRGVSNDTWICGYKPYTLQNQGRCLLTFVLVALQPHRNYKVGSVLAFTTSLIPHSFRNKPYSAAEMVISVYCLMMLTQL
jgi:hypothetical protein